MNLTFQNKKITGILTVVPKNEVKFDDEAANYNFPIAKSLRLKKIMGYNKHRIVDEETCVSDLCAFGLEYLIESNLVKEGRHRRFNTSNTNSRLFHTSYQ